MTRNIRTLAGTRKEGHMNSLLFRLFFFIFISQTSIYSEFAFSHAGQTGSTQCENLFARLRLETIQDLEPVRFQQTDHNLFTETLPTYIVSALSWLTAVQLFRGNGDPATLLAPAFALTAPTDLGLGVLSHYISLSQSETLKGLMSGKIFGKKYENVARAATNTALGTGAIVLSWLVSGVEISPGHCAAAGALCAAVYPTLQTVKTTLYRTWPRYQDRKRLNSLRDELPLEIRYYWNQVAARAVELGVTELETENAFLEVFNSLVLSVPYESRIPIESVNRVPELKVLYENIQKVKTPESLQVLRRKWVGLILERFPQYHSTLDLSLPFDVDNSLIVQRSLQERANLKFKRLLVSSIFDQMVSVGVAGGIFLYAVNHWAQTGEIPWFLGGSAGPH